MGRKRNRKVLFPAFEAAFLAFYRLNDDKAILTDDLLLEEGRSIRATQGISEDNLRLSNGWLQNVRLDTASSSMCFTARHNRLIALNSQ